MALFQPAGRAPLFIVMSSNRARYGIMASATSLRISVGILSGLIDLLFSDRCYSLSNNFNIRGEGFSAVSALYMWDVTLAAEYRRIIEIKRIRLFYRFCDGPSITVFDGRNIFPMSFALFYILVEIRPVFTFFV